ncbi:hypothetical protein Gbem_3587 [Citrifermentans bemidjiense Bem]|uniref:Uncharacterized protein n=1 Tax=Citrifermentans bemidjiense (strain ATCC BAA-1014 / DSM 16622 / JCM 12645 / Bem) TaxID=404380 RepID=B5ECW2_CITBB|nr:hypothetical protein Gbem_3587 [Citrifermentans bemidjiense Bem]
MTQRKSALFAWVVALLSFTLAGLLIHAQHKVGSASPVIAANAMLVRQLQLTDLCVFTEASYTRNPAVAGAAPAFQDSPLSFEHFPSGALVQPHPAAARNVP